GPVRSARSAATFWARMDTEAGVPAGSPPPWERAASPAVTPVGPDSRSNAFAVAALPSFAVMSSLSSGPRNIGRFSRPLESASLQDSWRRLKVVRRLPRARSVAGSQWNRALCPALVRIERQRVLLHQSLWSGPYEHVPAGRVARWIHRRNGESRSLPNLDRS